MLRLGLTRPHWGHGPCFDIRCARQGGIAGRKEMIDREHKLSVSRQAKLLGFSRRPPSSLDRQTPDQAYFNALAPMMVAAYSLMLTCRACGIEPLAHLRHVLSELPQRATDADIIELLPFNFEKTTAA